MSYKLRDSVLDSDDANNQPQELRPHMIGPSSLGRSPARNSPLISSPILGRKGSRHSLVQQGLASPLLAVDSSSPYNHLSDSETAKPTTDANGSASVQTPLLPTEKDGIMNGYLWGQIGNVAKMGVWWTIFGPLILAIFDGKSVGVGIARASFNAAMLIFSPIAGALVEKIAIRKVLTVTTTVRGFVYGVFIPAAWILLTSGWVFLKTDTRDNIFYGIFFFLIFFDGIMVSFANVVDIDCGGADLVAAQNGIAIDDVVRNRFNSLHEGFFDGSMLILSPLVALGGLVGAHFIGESYSAKDVAAIIGAMGILFILTTFYSLYHYMRYLPKRAKGVPGFSLTCEQVSGIFSSIKEGLKICWSNAPIRWRLIFLSLETSFEDAMISLVIAEYGIKAIEENRDYAMGNVWANAIIACGKFGGIVSAVLMHKYWKAPESKESTSAFRPLFFFVFIAGLCSALLPISLWMRNNTEMKTLSVVLAFVGSFLFFLFSTAPKIGFATLLQGLAAETDASGRIFGFVAAFLTIMDSLVLLGLSAIFSYFSLQTSLWITCGAICLHGFMELIFGPCLVLRK